MLTWLLSYALSSTLLLLLALVLSPRARSHRVREALWKTALFGGFITATAQSVGVSSLLGSIALRPLAVAPAPSPDRSVLPEAPAAKAEKKTELAAEPVATFSGTSQSNGSGSRLSVTQLAGPVWLSLAGLLLAIYLVRRSLLGRRIANRRPVMTHPLADQLRNLADEVGIDRPIRLTASPRLASPVALGSSEIAVPEVALTELDPEQQRGMLAHELAHLERHDPAWLIAASLAERIGFFQPLNRLARRKIQESAEYLCDEWAVRQTGSGVFLAKCLAKVAEWMDQAPSAVPVAGMAEERSHLVARVRRLLDNAPFPRAPRPRTVALLAGLGVLGVTLAVPRISLAGVDPLDSASLANRDEATIRTQPDTNRAVVRALMEASRDPEVEVRRAALQSLANYEEPGTVGIFREALKDGDVEIRKTAIQALKQLKDKGSVSAIAVLLRDDNVEVRREAADAFDELPAAGVRAELVAALKDSDAEVRAEVIEALGRLKDPAAVEALKGALKDPRAEVRAKAIEALHEMDLPNPPAEMLDGLKDPNAEVRHEAAHAAGHFAEDPRAVPGLRALLEDPSADVREAAVEALAEIGTESAIDALVAALKSKDAKVRKAAADALGKH